MTMDPVGSLSQGDSISMNSPLSGRVIQISPMAPDRGVLAQSAKILRDGGLVVAPTETRYGLLARADSPEALANLYSVKERPANLTTAVFFADLSELRHRCELSGAAERLAEHFLPGPLTLVCEAKEPTRRLVHPPAINSGIIGVRISPARVIVELLKLVDFPLTATSANLSGRPDVTTVAEIDGQLNEGVDLYLDSGPLSGPTSTVVDVTGPELKVLREGAIPTSELEKVFAGK